MHRYRNPGNTELSLLAKGTGLIGGGVELECFEEDGRSFTLNGECFIKPSKSREGHYAKPYRKCQLALPKTYVTRRGQMVLFTSPEDMLIGQSVVLQHRKEITSERAATRLKTVNRLVSSSLDYQPVKGQSSEVGEFTPVYLQRLREVAERAKETENYQAQSLGKDEENMEEDDLEAADSGVGASLRPSSSGRLSSLSHYSDAAPIQIPDGRLLEENEEDMGIDMSTDPLKSLAGELSGYMPTGQKAKTKGKTSKKKKTMQLEQASTQKHKSSSKTKGKKRKRGKKSTKDDVDGGVVSQGGSKVNSNHVSDIERKKREKRELERQREAELRERERLEAELRKLQEDKTRLGVDGQSENGTDECEGERGGGMAQREFGGGRRGEGVSMANGGRSETSVTEDREDSKSRGQTEAEKTERARQAYEKGAKLREKSNYNNHLELNTLRHTQSISPAYTFSYFRHVPPRTNNGKTGGKGAGSSKGARGGQKPKRRKPPEK